MNMEQNIFSISTEPPLAASVGKQLSQSRSPTGSYFSPTAVYSQPSQHINDFFSLLYSQEDSLPKKHCLSVFVKLKHNIRADTSVSNQQVVI